MKIITQVVFLICTTASSFVLADVKHILDISTTSTPPPPPHPYVFSYSAGRYPGHIDRTHSEVSDGSGTVQGSFSYIDPKHEVRTVQYIADQYGFHPQLSHEPQEPQDTDANLRAKAKHFKLYHKIAEAHSNPDAVYIGAVAPVDSEAVARAKHKHFTLYEKIAQDHAIIAAEREAQRLAFEATSEVNQLEDEEKH